MSDILDEAQALADMTDDLWLAFMKKDKMKVLLGCGLILAGTALGAATTGYLVARRKLTKEFEEELALEIAKTRAFVNRLAKDEISVPQQQTEELRTVEEAADALAKYQGRGEKEEEDAEPEVRVEVNVFTQSESNFEWDYDEEAKMRDPETPYVIHEDEWSESELEKMTLTYYEGDQTLADEKDEPIPIIEEVVGIENLERFGHGTGDARTVFVRNERMNTEFEIVKHDGKFAEEVLGFRHSEERYPMRHPNRSRRDVDE